MSNTQVILNPHAAGGRAGHLWSKIEPLLRERLGEFIVAITQHPSEVTDHLESAYNNEMERVISVGGDGTNHALVNSLVYLKEKYPNYPPLPYGMLPVGTGRDWARSRGIPLDLTQAADWLVRATPRPTDIGLASIGYDEPRRRHFLNIASVGLGGAVDARVEHVTARRPWTYLKATVEAILTYEPQHLRVITDGKTWYDDRALVVVIANGTTFGHGMKIAPEASTHDGLFDVLVVEALPRVQTLAALYRVYNGSHLQHPGVHFTRAREVRIESETGPVAVDLDGEYDRGAEEMTFSVQPGLLHLFE